MFKDLSPVLLIVLVLVVGGLVYLMLPGRLNGPASTETSTSTASSTFVVISASSSDGSTISSTSTFETFEQTGS